MAPTSVLERVSFIEKFTQTDDNDDDETSVQLISSDRCSDNNSYINANFVFTSASIMPEPNPTVSRKYILTQGPLLHTCQHFWLMVWEQQSSLIIMLNQVVEKMTVKCAQYFPTKDTDDADLKTSQPYLFDSNFRVDFVDEHAEDNFAIFRTLKLTNLETDEQRIIKHCQFTRWPDFGVPESTTNFLQFLFAVRKTGFLGQRTPPVIHCSAGIGRSGTFVVVDIALLIAQQYGAAHIDVCNIINELRKQRMGLIQTSDQLRFCWLAIKDAVEQPEKWADLVNCLGVECSGDTPPPIYMPPAVITTMNGGAEGSISPNRPAFEREFAVDERPPFTPAPTPGGLANSSGDLNLLAGNSSPWGDGSDSRLREKRASSASADLKPDPSVEDGGLNRKSGEGSTPHKQKKVSNDVTSSNGALDHSLPSRGGSTVTKSTCSSTDSLSLYQIDGSEAKRDARISTFDDNNLDSVHEDTGDHCRTVDSPMSVDSTNVQLSGCSSSHVTSSTKDRSPPGPCAMSPADKPLESIVESRNSPVSMHTSSTSSDDQDMMTAENSPCYNDSTTQQHHGDVGVNPGPSGDRINVDESYELRKRQRANKNTEMKRRIDAMKETVKIEDAKHQSYRLYIKIGAGVAAFAVGGVIAWYFVS